MWARVCDAYMDVWKVDGWPEKVGLVLGKGSSITLLLTLSLILILHILHFFFCFCSLLWRFFEFWLYKFFETFARCMAHTRSTAAHNWHMGHWPISLPYTVAQVASSWGSLYFSFSLVLFDVLWLDFLCHSIPRPRVGKG